MRRGQERSALYDEKGSRRGGTHNRVSHMQRCFNAPGISADTGDSELKPRELQTNDSVSPLNIQLTESSENQHAGGILSQLPEESTPPVQLEEQDEGKFFQCNNGCDPKNLDPAPRAFDSRQASRDDRPNDTRRLEPFLPKQKQDTSSISI